MPRRRVKRITNYELRVKDTPDDVGNIAVLSNQAATKIKVRIKKSRKKAKGRGLKQEQYQMLRNEDQDMTIADKDKKIIMWSGITFFMVLIIGFWLFNIKTIFKTDSSTDSGGQQFNWSEIRDELNQTMAEVKENLSEIKDLQDQNALNTLPSGSGSIDAEQQIEQLKDRLLSEKSLGGLATSTATTTTP